MHLLNVRKATASEHIELKLTDFLSEMTQTSEDLIRAISLLGQVFFGACEIVRKLLRLRVAYRLHQSSKSRQGG